MASSHARPFFDRRRATMLTAVSRITAPMAHHHLLKNPDMLNSMRVGSGSFALREEKNVRNLGKTNAARTTTVNTAITAHDSRGR